MQNKNIIVGKKGENLAKDYLVSLGYQIVETNWHYSKNAEIDIIAKDNQTLVFVEVKTRSNLNYGHPFESINYTKMQKIHKAISGYFQTKKVACKSYRIDGIAVIGLNNPKIEHLKNIGQF